MKKISIIVPVYNVEKYISRCLDSIIEQNMDDMEVICVEDCSTDGSKMILQEYESNSLINAIYNVKNVGLGEARNIGLSKADGEYVWFVDSDDWIEPNSVRELYEVASRNKLDILCFGANQVFEDSIAKKKSEYSNNSRTDIKKPISGEEALCHLIERCSYDGTAWKKIYRRALIVEMRFPADVYHEDEVFSMQSMIRAKRVMATTNRYYNYYRRVNSITIPNSGLTEKHCISIAKIVYDIEKLMSVYSGYAQDAIYYYYSKMGYSLSNSYRHVDSFSRDYLTRWKSLKHIVGVVGGMFYNGFFPRKLSPEMMTVLRKSSGICIYGAGRVGQGLHELLDERGIEVDSFIVTDECENKMCKETPIVSIDSLSSKSFDSNVFLIAMIDIEACQLIKETLIDKGVETDRVYNYYDLR